MDKTASARIPSLDGFRAISILLVILSHMVLTHGFPEIQSDPFQPLGALGVRVFFVISGFLITTLLLKELEKSSTIRLPRFYFRRTMRIFVPYYFFLLVILVLHRLDLASVSWRDWLHSLTYTVNYFPGRAWEIGHAWSLSMEEQFYLIWPAVLLLSGKRRGTWIALGFILAAPLIRMAYYFFQPHLVDLELGYRFETAGDALATGCLLALLQTRLQAYPLYHKLLSSRLLILLPVLVLYAAYIPTDHKKYLVAAIPLMNLGIAICIAWGIAHPGGILGRLLNWRPVVLIGLMSYSLYLYQQIFLNPHSTLTIARFPLNLIIMILAASFSYLLIERPSLDLRQHIEDYLDRRQARTLAKKTTLKAD